MPMRLHGARSVCWDKPLGPCYEAPRVGRSFVVIYRYIASPQGFVDSTGSLEPGLSERYSCPSKVRAGSVTRRRDYRP